MAQLTDEEKTLVVQELACFATPSEAAATVAETFGTTPDRMQCWKYHPDNNPRLPDRWRVLFAATREKFLADTAAVGIAHRNFRLRRLDAYLRHAESKKNHPLAIQILKQAAEEVGGALTNERRVSRPDGGPVVEIYPRVLLPDNGRDPIGCPPAAGGTATTGSCGNRGNIDR
ncbi:MAG TPA: DUF2280 domain-containing protein [Terriglobia bacterium]|nr:DUF2280 domain-containing protein [Terriglobia bacterium]